MTAFLSRIYSKSELSFALLWICTYCIANSLAVSVSDAIGITHSAELAFNLLTGAALLIWLRKMGLFRHYGLCLSRMPAARFMYYVPLVLLMSQNLWRGVAANMPAVDTLCFVLSMTLVGLLEELIFRGLLFKALSASSVRSAAIISSLTFGLGHIINLFNGSGMTLIANILQILTAIAWGFMFVMIFHRSGSILPCIIAHSVNNALSAFASRTALSAAMQISLSAIGMSIALGYALWLYLALRGVRADS